MNEYPFLKKSENTIEFDLSPRVFS